MGCEQPQDVMAHQGVRATRGTRSIHGGEIRGGEGVGEVVDGGDLGGVGSGDGQLEEFGAGEFNSGGVMGERCQKIRRGFLQKIRRFVRALMDHGKQYKPWVKKKKYESMVHDQSDKLIPSDVW